MRRVRVKQVTPGPLTLDAAESHHLRDVLRMKAGDAVEVFDADGRTAQGTITTVDARSVAISVENISEPTERRLLWTVASAVPKGNRADWMIEKLSELGTHRFVPLATQRSVVHPEGKAKRERWSRIATEAARQSRRTGVMRIGDLVDLTVFLRDLDGPGWYFSTGSDALPATAAPPIADRLNLLIGPEGGWTDEEMQQMRSAGLTPVSLGATILRVETAAVAAAALVAAIVAPCRTSAAASPAPDPSP